MKVEIEIPDPPEGWVYEGYRQGLPGELILRGSVWMRCEWVTGFGYHIAVKSKPLWEPSPELLAVLQPGWLAKDHDGKWYWYGEKPTRLQCDWEGTSMHSMSRVRRTVLPPDSIPWDQCCFKIGEQE